MLCLLDCILRMKVSHRSSIPDFHSGHILNCVFLNLCLEIYERQTLARVKKIKTGSLILLYVIL